jgi:predicted DNA-binding protein
MSVLNKKGGSSDSARINISLSPKTIASIERDIEAIGCFNGKSDFAVAAIREFLIKLHTFGLKKLSEVSDTQDPLGAYTLKMRNLGQALNESLQNVDTDPRTKQISIRLEPSYMEMLQNMSLLLGWSNQTLCRFAIYQYIECVKEIAKERLDYINEYNRVKGEGTYVPSKEELKKDLDDFMNS